MCRPVVPSIAFVLLVLLSGTVAAPVLAGEPVGEFEFTGKRGAAFLSFQEGGMFDGIATLRGFGMTGLSGTVLSITWKVS